MRLVDKGAKFLGKFNILDLTVLSLALLLIVALFANKIIPNRMLKDIRRMPKEKEVIVRVILDRERNFLARHIKAGDGQEDLENNFRARVLKVETAGPLDSPETVIVTLKLRASEDGAFLIYAGKILRPGEVFSLETKGYFLSGFVYSLEGQAK
jgi:hypothetical protein